MISNVWPESAFTFPRVSVHVPPLPVVRDAPSARSRFPVEARLAPSDGVPVTPSAKRRRLSHTAASVEVTMPAMRWWSCGPSCRFSNELEACSDRSRFPESGLNYARWKDT
jgi:hypothetical protein